MSNNISRDVYLIGEEIKQLPRSQLPTIRHILCYYRYKQRSSPKTTVHQIAKAIVDEVYALWSKLGVRLRGKKHSITK